MGLKKPAFIVFIVGLVVALALVTGIVTWLLIRRRRMNAQVKQQANRIQIGSLPSIKIEPQNPSGNLHEKIERALATKVKAQIGALTQKKRQRKEEESQLGALTQKKRTKRFGDSIDSRDDIAFPKLAVASVDSEDP